MTMMATKIVLVDGIRHFMHLPICARNETFEYNEMITCPCKYMLVEWMCVFTICPSAVYLETNSRTNSRQIKVLSKKWKSNGIICVVDSSWCIRKIKRLWIIDNKTALHVCTSRRGNTHTHISIWIMYTNWIHTSAMDASVWIHVNNSRRWVFGKGINAMKLLHSHFITLEHNKFCELHRKKDTSKDPDGARVERSLRRMIVQSSWLT